MTVLNEQGPRVTDGLTAPTTSRGPVLIDYAMLLVLGLVWGSAFLFTEIAVRTVPPATTVAMRLVIAAGLLALIAQLLGARWPRGWRTWAVIFASGLMGNALPFTMISWGQQEVPSGLAAILMGVMPLATLVLAHFFTADEKLNAAKTAGVLLGLGGLVVLIGPGKLMTLGSDVVSELVIAAAAVSYGINTLITKSLMGHEKVGLGASVMLASALVMVPVALAWDGIAELAPSFESLASVVVLGIFQTALAALLMFVIIKRSGATFFSQINYIVPPAGLVYGILLLGEEAQLKALAALALIIIGIAVSRLGMGQAHRTAPPR
ncbi:MAG: DMT family transporter [Pseudomonadota bacterium]